MTAGMAAGMADADADAVEFVVAIVGRPEHLLREVAAMKTCCVVGRSFEAEAAGCVHAVADP